MDTKRCLECGNDFFGRADKKFCTDACRNAFNNKVNSSTTSYIRQINRKLKQNRLILAKLNNNGKTKKHRDQLLKEGFDFDFCTHTYLTRDQKEYKFCYEQGYLVLDEGFILLVKRDNSEERHVQ